MGDAVCMLSIPSTNYETPLRPERTSSLRRSLQLTHGLRQLTRSLSGGYPGDDNNTSHRRSTISTMEPSSNTLHVRIVPSIENPSRSLIFDIFDRELGPADTIKVGRFTDRSPSPSRMSFKTKVVSRSHCEFWAENGKLFIRDTKSSSGTFLNHIRICPPNHSSQPHEIKDGDIVQLGVDYQGGIEEVYRSVKMRFEVNKSRRSRPMSFNMTAFQNIRKITGHRQSTTTSDNSNPCSSAPDASMDGIATTSSEQVTEDASNPVSSSLDMEECCICLYSLAPQQGLFVSPCAHTYHYKCIRPLLLSYPGFQCPICRTYSDLDACTSLESHQIMSSLGSTDQQQQPNSLSTDHMNIISNSPAPQPQLSLHTSPPTPTTDDDDDMTPLASFQATDPHNAPTQAHRLSGDPPNNNAPTRNEIEEDPTTTPEEATTSGFVEKLKMAWFEKRKSATGSTKKRPLSYPHFLRRHEDEATSSGFTGQTLSRQSTTHLAEIEEQDEPPMTFLYTNM